VFSVRIEPAQQLILQLTVTIVMCKQAVESWRIKFQVAEILFVAPHSSFSYLLRQLFVSPLLWVFIMFSFGGFLLYPTFGVVDLISRHISRTYVLAAGKSRSPHPRHKTH
jgi:hypothetical protein